jgi:hypothetical protein
MYDLHFHTTQSDGVNSSEEMVDAAIARWVRFLACTDHDIVNREVPRLVWEFHTRIENVYVQQASYIDIVEWAEVSVGHKDGIYEKSMHIATYSRHFWSEYDTFLARIRDGRVEKIKLQCRTLDSHGFRIVSSGKIVPFSLDNLFIRFPSIRPDNLSNAHIKEKWMKKIFSNSDSNGVENIHNYYHFLMLYQHMSQLLNPLWTSLIEKIRLSHLYIHILHLPHSRNFKRG